MESGAAPGLEQVAPGIRRLLADNPSPFTFTGTQTYVVGEREVAVIDPGPDEPAHVERLLASLGDERVNAILVTHTHRDHSPASRPLARATGAPIIGCPPIDVVHDGALGEDSFDADYRPDIVLGNGSRLAGEGWTIEALKTPGHTANHLCFAFLEAKALFSGDHVMGWATSVVVPPEGDMGDYIASLEKLLTRDDRTYYPTHGPEIADGKRRVRELIKHRRQREEQILDHLRAGEGRISAMVPNIYRGTDPRLFPAAELSVLAHLLHLQRRGRVEQTSEEWHLIG